MLALLACCVTSPLYAQTKIIYDTDMDTDCDDVGALAVLHALADKGEVEILATIVSSRYPWSAPCTDVLNQYYGRGDIPIGAPKTTWAETGFRGSPYAKQISEQSAPYTPRYASNDDAPDAVEVYRRVLVSQKDNSVVILTVGYLTNIRDLLASQPDDISPLNGIDLVRQKVSRWVCTGGTYPRDLNPAVRGNFQPDPLSAAIAVRDWPGVIYFTGLGDHIHTGGRLHETPDENPVRRAYKLMLRDVKTRPSWDLIAVLFAIRSDSDFWRLHTGGHYHIFDNGTSEWREALNKEHYVLQLKENTEKALRETLDELMIQKPKAK